MNNTREVDCIIQDGVRYCEKVARSSDEWGLLLLGMLAFGLWAAFWFWLAFTKFYEQDGYVAACIFGGIFGIPLLVGGIVLLLV